VLSASGSGKEFSAIAMDGRGSHVTLFVVRSDDGRCFVVVPTELSDWKVLRARPCCRSSRRDDNFTDRQLQRDRAGYAPESRATVPLDAAQARTARRRQLAPQSRRRVNQMNLDRLRCFFANCRLDDGGASQ